MSNESCQQCGACCASYRVSFYWAETDEAPGGRVPASLTEKLDPYQACMRGTIGEPIRCIALSGMVGESVKCNIYEWRPSPCHDLLAGSDGCNRARIRWGLEPLD
jgi:hypothetical protein